MANISSYKNKVDDLIWSGQDKMKTAQKYVKAIKNSWSGASEGAFQEAYSDVHREFNKVSDRLRRISNKLNSLQSSMDAADKDKIEKKRQAYKK